MGSKGDLEWSSRIKKTLEEFGIEVLMRVSSAHKTPEKCLEIIRQYENQQQPVVFITVAGRSNALSGFVDAQTSCPVIACPPYSDRFAGADIFSSLRMPSGVCPVVVLEPEAAALAAVKILALTDTNLKKRFTEYQNRMKEKIYQADQEVSGG